MTHPGETTSPHLNVIAATPDQESILTNLLELYAHDFSEFRNLELGEDGRFGYPSLLPYWSEPGQYPFLLRMDGKLAGLALVKRVPGCSGNGAIWDMAEFFVVRGCRRRGLGTQAAHEVWRRFPGLWEVRVMHANVSAQHFWAGAIARFTGDEIQPVHVEKAGERWSIFSFESKAESLVPLSF